MDIKTIQSAFARARASASLHLSKRLQLAILHGLASFLSGRNGDLVCAVPSTPSELVDLLCMGMALDFMIAHTVAASPDLIRAAEAIHMHCTDGLAKFGTGWLVDATIGKCASYFIFIDPESTVPSESAVLRAKEWERKSSFKDYKGSKWMIKEDGPWKTPRTVQSMALEKVIHSTETRTILHIPCAAGKTAIGVAAAFWFCKGANANIIWLTTSVQAAEQVKDALLKCTNVTEEEILLHTAKGPRRNATFKNFEGKEGIVVIATYAMMSQSGKASQFSNTWIQSKTFKVLVCDEAQRALAPEWYEGINCINSERRIGLSGSLYREGDETSRGDDIDSQFAPLGKVVLHMPWKCLAEMGFIASFRVMKVFCKLHPIEVVQQSSPSTCVEKLEVASAIFKIHAARGHLCIIFSNCVLFARVLADHLKLDVLEGEIDGTQRTKVIEQMRNSSIQGVVLTSIGDVAIDINNSRLRAIVLAHSSRSRAAFMQRMGRAVRMGEEIGESNMSGMEGLLERLKNQKNVSVYDLYSTTDLEPNDRGRPMQSTLHRHKVLETESIPIQTVDATELIDAARAHSDLFPRFTDVQVQKHVNCINKELFGKCKTDGKHLMAAVVQAGKLQVELGVAKNKLVTRGMVQGPIAKERRKQRDIAQRNKMNGIKAHCKQNAKQAYEETLKKFLRGEK